jgi:hypothetical protein
MRNIAVAGTGYVGLVYGHLFCRHGQPGHLSRHQRRENRDAAPGRIAHLRAGSQRDDRAQCQGGAASLHHLLRGGAGRGRIHLHLRGHAQRRRRRGRPAVRAHGGRIGRQDHEEAAHRHQQEHCARGHRRLGGRHHQAQPAGAGRVCRGELPGIHPRRLGARRLYEPGPRGASAAATGTPRSRWRSSAPASARPHRHDRPAHRRDDQVRQQRFPGHQDQLHQRDRRDLREAGRGRRRSGHGHGLRQAHRRRTSSTRGWATAAVASPRMSRRWSTWRWCMGRTRRCCAR